MTAVSGPAPDGAALHIPGNEGRADAWWLADLRPAPGYLGALGSARRYRSALGIDPAARSASA